MWRWGLTDPARRVGVQVDPRVLFRSCSPPLGGGPDGSRVENGDNVKCRNRWWSLRAKFLVFLWVRSFLTRSIYEEGGCVCFSFRAASSWLSGGGEFTLILLGLTVQGDGCSMTGQHSPGDNRGTMDSGSDRLSNHGGMSRGSGKNCYRGGMSRGSGNDCHRGGMGRGGNDCRGGDRTKSTADRKAGETTGSGERDSHDGSEDSLWRRAR